MMQYDGSTYMTPAMADGYVEQLNADEATEESGFKYTAEHGPKWSRVAVYDELGLFLGYL